MDIYCDGEPGLFPESEFLHSNGVLVQPPVHQPHGAHYAIGGIPVGPSSIDSLLLPNPAGGRNPSLINSLPLVVTLDTGETLIQIAAGIPVSFYPEREKIEIGPLRPGEVDILRRGTNAEEELNERRSLVIQLYRTASELSTEMLQELVNYAQGLSNK